ncbi:hypothetical protein DASC09_004440 [Saccharomycopsis crataegensis]|uniref:Uncharacterized protein n=1 Tax=Saccharomycopsis crataegensis TaxID=43959 RepID=A0AAV5QFK7_9ASCO|nr:hypothetical protein DASC09_004440 [Saccharomycopsis crataegensis]
MTETIALPNHNSLLVETETINTSSTLRLAETDATGTDTTITPTISNNSALTTATSESGVFDERIPGLNDAKVIHGALKKLVNVGNMHLVDDNQQQQHMNSLSLRSKKNNHGNGTINSITNAQAVVCGETTSEASSDKESSNNLQRKSKNNMLRAELFETDLESEMQNDAAQSDGNETFVYSNRGDVTHNPDALDADSPETNNFQAFFDSLYQQRHAVRAEQNEEGKEKIVDSSSKSSQNKNHDIRHPQQMNIFQHSTNPGNHDSDFSDLTSLSTVQGGAPNFPQDWARRDTAISMNNPFLGQNFNFSGRDRHNDYHHLQPHHTQFQALQAPHDIRAHTFKKKNPSRNLAHGKSPGDDERIKNIDVNENQLIRVLEDDGNDIDENEDEDDGYSSNDYDYYEMLYGSSSSKHIAPPIVLERKVSDQSIQDTGNPKLGSPLAYYTFDTKNIDYPNEEVEVDEEEVDESEGTIETIKQSLSKRRKTLSVEHNVHYNNRISSYGKIHTGRGRGQGGQKFQNQHVYENKGKYKGSRYYSNNSHQKGENQNAIHDGGHWHDNDNVNPSKSVNYLHDRFFYSMPDSRDNVGNYLESKEQPYLYPEGSHMIDIGYENEDDLGNQGQLEHRDEDFDESSGLLSANVDPGMMNYHSITSKLRQFYHQTYASSPEVSPELKQSNAFFSNKQNTHLASQSKKHHYQYHQKHDHQRKYSGASKKASRRIRHHSRNPTQSSISSKSQFSNKSNLNNQNISNNAKGNQKIVSSPGRGGFKLRAASGVGAGDGGYTIPYPSHYHHPEYYDEESMEYCGNNGLNNSWLNLFRNVLVSLGGIFVLIGFGFIMGFFIAVYG